MKRFFAVSLASHAAAFAVLIFFGALLSKPRMSYYSVDLFSALPAGGAAPVSAPTVPVAPEPVAPKPQDEEPPKVKEAIRLPEKHPKKIVPPVKQVKPKDVPTPVKPEVAPPKRKSLSDYMYKNDSSSDQPPAARTGSGGLGTVGIVGDSGAAFPYPWYLKTIAERLDKQWKPPKDFAEDTLCQVIFTIHRDGSVTDSEIEKSSSDNFYDQLALRAVAYTTMPPLPDGYPGDTLRVHMKFMGKR